MRIRTADLLITNQLLYQLSYVGFSVQPQIASFGPERRFRSFEILDIAYTMPVVSKSLMPCSESKSTTCGRTLDKPN